MSKTEQANQLRLAAKLIETGHPFEFRDAGEWIRAITVTPDHAICERREIRPILATPPDGRPLHNPDGLSAEQVGIGYRLCLVGETLPEGYDFWYRKKWDEGCFPGKQVPEYECDCSCRVPLSVPWPEAKPDPYAELKAAHAAGKVIEVFVRDDEYGPDRWSKKENNSWTLLPEKYRIKLEPCAEPKQVELGPEDVIAKLKEAVAMLETLANTKA